MLARLLLLINLLLPNLAWADDPRWYLLDSTVLSMSRDLNTLYQDNKRIQFKGNNLSAVYSNDRTQVLIKIPDSDLEFRAYIDTNFTVLRVYTVHDHTELVALLNFDPNWSNTRKEEE